MMPADRAEKHLQLLKQVGLPKKIGKAIESMLKPGADNSTTGKRANNNGETKSTRH